jgi:hypothetical protein
MVVVSPNKDGMELMNHLTGTKEFTIQEILFTRVWFLTVEQCQTFLDVRSILIPSGKRGLTEVHI